MYDPRFLFTIMHASPLYNPRSGLAAYRHYNLLLFASVAPSCTLMCRCGWTYARTYHGIAVSLLLYKLEMFVLIFQTTQVALFKLAILATNYFIMRQFTSLAFFAVLASVLNHTQAYVYMYLSSSHIHIDSLEL